MEPPIEAKDPQTIEEVIPRGLLRDRRQRAGNTARNNRKDSVNADIKEIEINGMKYVLKGTENTTPPTLEKLVIIRSESAGVFFGELEEKDMPNGLVKMKNARRLWYWSGAASLSQLAVDGTSKPKDCKFPVSVPEITVAKVIEIIPVTQKAADSLNGVPVWKT